MIINNQPQQPRRSTFSQQVIKDQNTMLLLNLVRRYAPISRAELARRSGLSPATVSMLAEELIHNQWVQEQPAPAMPRGERGRRPILLSLNASRGYVATVEILSRGYICALYDICLHKIASIRCRDTAATGAEISQALVQLARGRHILKNRILGVHILFPGLFDAESGELGFSAVIDEADMVQRDLASDLRSRLPQAQVLVSNDATMVAYSEFIAERTAATPLLAMTIHEGINAGVVMDSRSCLPVEAGHIIIQQRGPLCKCGNRGCLETFCGTPALLRALRSKTSLSLGDGEDVMVQVAEALASGDAAVRAVLEDYTYALCCGLVSIINLFAVRAVRIGGAVHVLGAPFEAMVRRTLDEGFHVVTHSRELDLSLFDDDYESSRQAAVVSLLERIFRTE